MELRIGQPIGSELSRLMDSLPFAKMSHLELLTRRLDASELQQVHHWLATWLKAVESEQERRKS